MPSVDVGPLHLVDHQIRVHPEQNVVKPLLHGQSLRSQVTPRYEYLRVIENIDREKLIQAKRQLESGASFYDVAHAISDGTAAGIGGFWGEKEVSKLEPALVPSVAKLDYSQITDVTRAGDRWYLIQRLPRDFKWQSGQLQRQAEALLSQSKVAEAIQTSQQALKLYPVFRRALTFIGTTLAQDGQMQRAADVLRVANRLYPTDAVSLFELAVVQSRLGQPDKAIAAYRQVLQLEPDFLAAYAKLAAALDSKGDPISAIAIWRQGLNIDPLSAEICYGLSLSLARGGELQESKRYAAMAAALDPRYSAISLTSP